MTAQKRPHAHEGARGEGRGAFTKRSLQNPTERRSSTRWALGVSLAKHAPRDFTDWVSQIGSDSKPSKSCDKTQTPRRPATQGAPTRPTRNFPTPDACCCLLPVCLLLLCRCATVPSAHQIHPQLRNPRRRGLTPLPHLSQVAYNSRQILGRRKSGKVVAKWARDWRVPSPTTRQQCV